MRPCPIALGDSRGLAGCTHVLQPSTLQRHLSDRHFSPLALLVTLGDTSSEPQLHVHGRSTPSFLSSSTGTASQTLGLLTILHHATRAPTEDSNICSSDSWYSTCMRCRPRSCTSSEVVAPQKRAFECYPNRRPHARNKWRHGSTPFFLTLATTTGCTQGYACLALRGCRWRMLKLSPGKSTNGQAHASERPQFRHQLQTAGWPDKPANDQPTSSLTRTAGALPSAKIPNEVGCVIRKVLLSARPRCSSGGVVGVGDLVCNDQNRPFWKRA